jgi:hypothetical protein
MITSFKLFRESYNTLTTAIAPLYPLTVLTRPTTIQQKAFELLEVAV